jgi:hypothetical protein
VIVSRWCLSSGDRTGYGGHGERCLSHGYDGYGERAVKEWRMRRPPSGSESCLLRRRNLRKLTQLWWRNSPVWSAASSPSTSPCLRRSLRYKLAGARVSSSFCTNVS